MVRIGERNAQLARLIVIDKTVVDLSLTTAECIEARTAISHSMR